jgi:hypothetical protein
MIEKFKSYNTISKALIGGAVVLGIIVVILMVVVITTGGFSNPLS